jgi:hypothetical protein
VLGTAVGKETAGGYNHGGGEKGGQDVPSEDEVGGVLVWDGEGGNECGQVDFVHGVE